MARRQKAAIKAQDALTEVTLPDVVHTSGGVRFDPRLDVWSYRENTSTVSLSFLKLKNISQQVCQSAKATLVWFAENRSAAHTENLFKQFQNFINFVAETRHSITDVTATDLLNYRAALTEKQQWYMRPLSVFLRKWSALGYPQVDVSAIKVLNEMRLKSNEKGAAVTTMDPYDGPLTDLEVEAIHAALNEAYANGKISKRHYLLAWVFMLFGQRPVQYANLRACDFSVSTSPEGSASYLLSIPRAKQRTGNSRSHFTTRAVLPQFGVLLDEYVRELRTEYGPKIAEPRQVPFFPGNFNSRAPKSFEYHLTANAIGRELSNVLSSLYVVSERTGRPIHITPTRFRRTIGTRAAAEGHGELVIAELLDHSDTSNAGVYVQATPAIVERIDRAIAMQLAPLAQAFAGVLIRDESEAERGDDPRSRIVDPRLGKGTQPMGNCGKHGFCGFAAPIACYTCINFQPWLDGPHEAMLKRLIEERDRLTRDTDARIASINDRTILAVAEVVRRCEAAHTLSVGGAHG